MMIDINKRISFIVLILMSIGTILNKYFITDLDSQWLVAMLLLSSYLVLFSYSMWRKNKSKINLIVFIIFSTEFIGVVCGYNVYTHYFPELIIALCFLGLYYKAKKIKQ